MYMYMHTDDLSLVPIILSEDWKLDLANSPSTATDERVQGTSHIQDTLT